MPVPPDHACYNLRTDPASYTKPTGSVDCATAHYFETVHVGAFAGAEADRSSPPPLGTPARRSAYEECAGSAATFLGGDWRTAQLWLAVAVPSSNQWSGGARWFRCDLLEINDPPTPRTASLQGALTGSSTLALGCFKVVTKNDTIDSMTPIDCATPHEAEFAGIFDAPDAPYPADETAREKLRSSGCRGVVLAFAHIPAGGSLPGGVGWIFMDFDKPDWERGDRGAGCYIMRFGGTFSRSVKGVGLAGL